MFRGVVRLLWRRTTLRDPDAPLLATAVGHRCLQQDVGERCCTDCCRCCRTVYCARTGKDWKNRRQLPASREPRAEPVASRTDAAGFFHVPAISARVEQTIRDDRLRAEAAAELKRVGRAEAGRPARFSRDPCRLRTGGDPCVPGHHRCSFEASVAVPAACPGQGPLVPARSPSGRSSGPSV